MFLALLAVGRLPYLNLLKLTHKARVALEHSLKNSFCFAFLCLGLLEIYLNS